MASSEGGGLHPSHHVTKSDDDPECCDGALSWSLFLVCNPAWFLEENQPNLRNLYTQFNAFSKVIGPTHLAVWFWKQNPSGWTPKVLGDVMDENRHNSYCTKFGLLPSESPHVLVTTLHPDSTEAVGDRKKVIVKLSGTNATGIQILLLKLTASARRARLTTSRPRFGSILARLAPGP